MNDVLFESYLKGILRLDARGTWHHNGTPFSNPQVRDLFFRSMVWRPDIQEFVIRIGKGEARFDCEDTAFFVTELDTTNLPWQIRLTDGTTEELTPETLATGNENQFYCTLKSGHRARFMRNCHQHLMQFCVSEDSIQIGADLISVKREEAL